MFPSGKMSGTTFARVYEREPGYMKQCRARREVSPKPVPRSERKETGKSMDIREALRKSQESKSEKTSEGWIHISDEETGTSSSTNWSGSWRRTMSPEEAPGASTPPFGQSATLTAETMAMSEVAGLLRSLKISAWSGKALKVKLGSQDVTLTDGGATHCLRQSPSRPRRCLRSWRRGRRGSASAPRQERC